MSSLFSEDKVPKAPADLHYGLRAEYQADDHPDKVNLVIGAYRDEEGLAWTLPVIKKGIVRGYFSDTEQAVQLHHQNHQQTHEYLPIGGDPTFYEAAAQVLFGSEFSTYQRRISSIQTISGTGALHLGAAFLSKYLQDPRPQVYLSTPTYDNFVPLFSHVQLPIQRYPYYSNETKSLNFTGMLQTLQSAPKGSIIVLQACAHNPTGVDPTPNQWEQLAAVVQNTGLFPFFDCAYQGFATGDLNRDSFAIRYFASQSIEMFVAQSFSKNLGLYGQRVGCLHFIARPGPDEHDSAMRVSSQLAVIQRSEISTPAAFSAKIAALVLNDDTLSKEWVENLRTMSGRISAMRVSLRKQLEDLGVPGDWSHITNQIGMFAYSGLTAQQVEILQSRWHIYMLPSGRMSVSGLNRGNIGYVALAIHDVVRSAE